MEASGSGPGHQSFGRQVRGRSLHDVLHDPGTGITQQTVIPLDPSRVLLIARAILTALASGAVHGYINPHTILLTDDGTALLVGDRVAPGATPANDIFALGMALFEAVEGYAPHPAEALPPMKNAGGLAPLIEALTRPDPTQRPDAAGALGMLRGIVVAGPGAGASASAASAADVTETRDLPQVGGGAAGPAAQAGGDAAGPLGQGGGAATPAGQAGGGGSGPHGGDFGAHGGGSGPRGGDFGAHGDGSGARGSGFGAHGGGSGAGGGASDDTSLLPPVPTDPGALGGTPAGMPGPPIGPAGPTESFAYPAYEAAGYSQRRRKVLVIGGAVTAVVVIGAVALGVTRPWHRTDNSVSTVPGVPTASTSVPETPSTSAPTTPSAATSTPTPTPTAPKATTLISMALCLDAASVAGGVHPGARVTATTCHGSPNQAWQLNPDGTIHSMADGNLCLDAAAPTGKVLNAAQISAWTCHGGPNQDWIWNPNGTVSPAANKGLCLDAAGPVPIHAGANVTAWPCNAGPNEKWAKQ